MGHNTQHHDGLSCWYLYKWVRTALIRALMAAQWLPAEPGFAAAAIWSCFDL